VYASKGKWKNYWEIKSVVDHTCVLEQLDASHHNLSSGFVASQMFARIVENPAFEPKSIILAIEEKFRYHILSWQRAFLALGPAITAFKHCRPVICINGTFLTGKYKGTILTVVSADDNNQLLPLAIAFAEGENGDSWYCFLERLKQMAVGDVSHVCVIHNRHKGILQAISDIKEGSQERYKAAQWPDMHSRWCMRHIGANFHRQFKNKELTKLFKRLCSIN
jgi:hypothetical protein